MAKTKSSLTNMVVVLVGFALAIAALLAWVNHVTEGPIAAKAEKTLADGIKKVMAAGDIKVTKTDTVRQMVEGKENVYVVYSGRAHGDERRRAGGCYYGLHYHQSRVP